MKIYIYDAKRSAIGKFKKTLYNTSAKDIGVQISKNIINNLKIKPKIIDEVIIGNVLASGLGQNIARQILIESNIPKNHCAFSVNMVCGSGLKAINLAYNDIKLSKIHCALAGGVENMSMSPFLINRFNIELPKIDSMIYDALTDFFSQKHMGITAENVAKKYKISRTDQDLFSFQSQMKIKNAQNNNLFKEEIIPIKTSNGQLFINDEFPRNDTSIEKLNELTPAFKKNGTVTAGNSSGINDGGALLLIGDESIKLRPLVEIIDFAEEGCNPKYMGMGPYYSIKKILKNNNLSIKDIDLFEINEAFASQSIAVIRELSKYYNIDEKILSSKTNINGGAIGLGHPVGASGARILTTLIYSMKRNKSKYGVASLCIGGGMGISILIKNVEV
jgi:acetyl-CoA C-acetyltransferase